MLEILIQKSVQYVGMPVEAMSREDKMKGLRYLDERGAFLVKKSSDRIAQYYEISRFTLYNYLDTIHSAAPEEE
jgi:predicted transcriptional regulator YheO